MLAYWLGKNGVQVVVVERSSSDNQSGQIVDVDGPSQEIVTRMGVMDEIQSRVTHMRLALDSLMTRIESSRRSLQARREFRKRSRS